MTAIYDDHVSFSQLTMVEQCPYQYFLLKMAGVEPVPNAFAQAGTLAHQLLASWAKGEIPTKDLPLEWVNRFAHEVTAPFPRYLGAKGYVSKLFGSILRYFEQFDGFPEYEVIGAEREFQSSLAGEHFVGIIDLILRDKKTGGLVLMDHKSCSLSSFKKNQGQMYRQLVLYSKYCADHYGVFPEKLCFNLFKENTIEERTFDSEDYMAARIWAEATIHTMKNTDITDWFITKPDAFFCSQLCGCRNECFYGRFENHKRKKDEGNEQKQTATVV